jgi:hypothetical protein
MSRFGARSGQKLQPDLSAYFKTVTRQKNGYRFNYQLLDKITQRDSYSS